MTLFYFTSTGNSLEVAKRLGYRCMSIPRLLASDFLTFEDDAIGIIFPCHFVDIPIPVRIFLRTAKFKTPYLFSVITYGEMCADVSQRLQDYAKQWGKHFDYINTLCMVDNYIVFWKMEKQLLRLPRKNVPQHLGEIIADVKARRNYIRPVSVLDRVKGGFLRLLPGFMIEPCKRHHIDLDRCNGCGTCVQVCTMGNILLEKGKPTFRNFCIGCGACTHICPKNAIRWKGERSEMRYRNPSISANEIIKSGHRI